MSRDSWMAGDNKQSLAKDVLQFLLFLLLDAFTKFFLRPLPREFKCAESCQISNSDFVYVTLL